MAREHFILAAQQRSATLNVLGTEVSVLADNARTQSYGITLQRGGEGTGPPPHSHDWDESFYVLEGAIEFLCDGEYTLCKPGTLVHVPRGTVHGFRYASGGGQMLEITGPGTLAAQMFTAVNDEIPPGPPDIPKVVAVLQRNGVTVA